MEVERVGGEMRKGIKRGGNKKLNSTEISWSECLHEKYMKSRGDRKLVFMKRNLIGRQKGRYVSEFEKEGGRSKGRDLG